MQPHRIILAGGHTTGHILPMVAVGHEFRRHARDVVVFGDRRGPEAELVPQLGFAFQDIGGAPLRGVRSGLRRLRSYGVTLGAFWQARRLLREAPVALVAGFGGYISAAPVLAARSLGIATVVFEPNALPGLTNRRLRRIADLRFVGLEATRNQPGWHDAIVAGHPIRREVLDVVPSARNGSTVRVLVTGGLRGSAFLNSALPGVCADLRRSGIAVTVRHQAGAYDTRALENAYAAAGVSATIDAFIAGMGEAYAECDVVVCAGGAGTLSEVAALGLPALVVPIANTADDHQAANARAFVPHMNAVSLREEGWSTARAAGAIAGLAASRNTRGLVRTEDAAATFVEHCERLIMGRLPACGSIERANR